MSSTRSELYGKASALEFIRQFADFHNIKIAARIILFCDNKGALSFVNTQRQRKLPLPTVTQLQHKSSRRRRLGINSDIKAVLATTLSDLPKVRAQWVAGHQDRPQARVSKDGTTTKPKRKKLSIDAIMNIEADQLAGQYLKDYSTGEGAPRPNAVHVPELGASLLLGGIRVTGKHAKNMKSWIARDRQRQYLQAKHEWSDSTFESIDWEIFGSVFRKLPQSKQWATSKFVHGWWNVGTQKAKIAPKAPREFFACPRCQSPDEDTEHVLQCNSGDKVRYDNVQQLWSNSYCMYNGIVHQLVFAEMHGWLKNTKADRPSFSELDETTAQLLREALEEQQAIGWDAFFRGYLSRKWRTAYEHCLPTGTKDPSTKAEKWIRMMIKGLWTYAAASWKDRNNALHKVEETKEQRKIMQKDLKLHEDIRQIFAIRRTYAVADQRFIGESYEPILNWSRQSKRRWLKMAKFVLAKSHERLQAGQTELTAFFSFRDEQRQTTTHESNSAINRQHSTRQNEIISLDISTESEDESTSASSGEES